MEIINTEQPINQPLPIPTQPPIKSKKSFKKWLLILLIIILVLSIPLGGYILLGKMGIKPNSPTGIVKNIKPTPAPDSTANWKTYTNPQYGYSIKYPTNANIAEGKGYNFNFQTSKEINNITITRTDVDLKKNNNWGDWYKLEIYTENSPSNLTAIDFINEYLRGRPTAVPSRKPGDKPGDFEVRGMSYGVYLKISKSLSDYKNGEINGVHAIFGNEYDYDVIFQTKNGKLYTFIYTGMDGSKVTPTTEKIITRILSTFKFIDQATPTPTCKPRPACLDLTPKCMIPETSDMCPKPSINCKVGGCSGEICQDTNAEPIMSTCIYKTAYACYKTAKCEVQQSGKCGWTQTQELISCLENTK